MATDPGRDALENVTRCFCPLSMRRALTALAALPMLALAACAAKTPLETSPDELIARALVDAEVAEADEVVDDLYALVAAREPLRWRWDDDGQAWVLLVTWTSWDGYRGQVGRTVPLGREVWVTAVPEVQDFCRASDLEGNALVRRLEQYLGLRPGSGKLQFVTMWARPEQVVRPCADPEVTDTTCEPTDLAEDLLLGGHDHRAWFNELRANSYRSGGYPWTRLGYTYDWAPGTDERGASEFLVPAGTEVEIASVVTTDDYCR